MGHPSICVHKRTLIRACPFVIMDAPGSLRPLRIELRAAGHSVTLQLAGPKGDRGASSLDWAIMDQEPVWGVTALQAVEELDAGPIWASRTFEMPASAARKSDLYNGSVTEAALQVIHQVVAKAADCDFVPEPLDYSRSDVWGQLRSSARQSERRFAWSDATEHIVRRIRAADGSPGVHARLCEIPVAVYDAHPESLPSSERGVPGTVVKRRHGAVLVSTGDGGVWVGHLRALADAGIASLKLPATEVLSGRLGGVPEAVQPCRYREISYSRDDMVGTVSFAFYNGAMSTSQCRRLRSALRHAVAQDTRVLLVRGAQPFANGIHLGVIEAATDPAAAAWANIVALDDVCQEIIMCTDQLVVGAVAGNAGAGGVMLALGADRVVLSDGVVLNPHYGTIGLHGSEYWTYVLPKRVGELAARSLTTRCLPIGATDAVRIGLADTSLPGDPIGFEQAVKAYTCDLATGDNYSALLKSKSDRRAADERRQPLQAYRDLELDEMRRDIFDDRHGFAGARGSFIRKRRPPIAAAAPAAS